MRTVSQPDPACRITPGQPRRHTDPVRARVVLVALAVLPLAGCARLDELLVTPTVTPAEWCRQRPCVEVGDVVVAEPTSTVLVFALAALWVAAGVYFAVTRRSQHSRTWLAVALVLGGVGAALAGVSYQAFSYELKCAGRTACVWTSGFEVGYSVTQAASVSAMLVAVSYALASVRGRWAVAWYAAANVIVYAVLAVVGMWLPSRALLSFEVLMLFALPGIVIVIVLAARAYSRNRDALSRSLLWAAVLLVVVQVAYFAYYAAGVTALLWADGTGVWFSENDVLHVGMVLWLVYVTVVVGRTLSDRPAETPVS